MYCNQRKWKAEKGREDDGPGARAVRHMEWEVERMSLQTTRDELRESESQLARMREERRDGG